MNENAPDPLPDWITLNDTSGKFEGTAPSVTEATNYSFILHSEWTTLPSGNTDQTVTLTVSPKPVEVVPEKEDTKITIPNTGGGAAAGAGISTINSAITGTPPTGIYFILHQLQLIILFLMIDPFIPETLKVYLEGQGFALVNFNFIPSADIPGFDIPIDWLETEQTNEALNALGIESGSTLVNNFSLFFMVG